MNFTINSKKFNVCATFFTRADGNKKSYLFLEHPEHYGVCGFQLFNRDGSAFRVTEDNARATAYRLLKKNPDFFRGMTKEGYRNA